VRIAGRVVDAWLIEGKEHFEIDGQVLDTAGTTLFAPKYGLNVRSSGTVSGAGAGPNGGTYSIELLNLDPE
jgi:hypothetical protein